MAYMNRPPRGGASLVELLVVIMIIVLIMTLVFPAIQSARDAARRIQCVNNMSQIGRAMSLYESALLVFPPASLGCDGSCSNYRNNRPTFCKACPTFGDESIEADARRTTASAFVLILPYIEQQALYKLAEMNTTGLWRIPNYHMDMETDWQTPAALQFIASRPAVYVCPSDASEPTFPAGKYGANGALATGSYAVCAGTFGPNKAKLRVKCGNDGMFLMALPRAASDITDGLSNTYLGGEVIAADSDASSNVWTMAHRNRDSWRSTQNPLNTAPAIGRLPYPGVECEPADVEDCRNGAFGSNHFWGANFLFADGHVRYTRNKIDLGVYRALSTIAGGETDIKP